MSTIQIVFSPAGGTAKVADIICRAWNADYTKIDLSDANEDFSKYVINNDDRVLIAMPSYAGRAPSVAIERLKQIRGNGANCTLVCVYGNRAFDDTLVEMEDAAKACGFNIVAAIAAIAENAILPRYAAGKPDEADKKQLERFAAQIAEKTSPVSAIPGKRPYRRAIGTGLVPKPDDSCVQCGLCAARCPVQAINPATFTANAKKCITCMRCLKLCPRGARKTNRLIKLAGALLLNHICSQHKENTLFL